MKLIIVESPTKCETIKKYLGNEYNVIASYGHIRDLSTTGKGGLGVNIEEDFIDKNFITFLMSNLNDFEKDLLQANLKNIAFKDICIKYEMKKTTISNRNWKFKEKIKGLIELYNK